MPKHYICEGCKADFGTCEHTSDYEPSKKKYKPMPMSKNEVSKSAFKLVEPQAASMTESKASKGTMTESFYVEKTRDVADFLKDRVEILKERVKQRDIVKKFEDLKEPRPTPRFTPLTSSQLTPPPTPPPTTEVSKLRRMVYHTTTPPPTPPPTTEVSELRRMLVQSLAKFKQAVNRIDVLEVQVDNLERRLKDF